MNKCGIPGKETGRRGEQVTLRGNEHADYAANHRAELSGYDPFSPALN
jgi:hypothetical protein